jgi:gliding motility-associated transport system permease protein
MPSETMPESPASTEKDAPFEAAPSLVAAEEFSFARTIGLAGVMLAVLGAAVVLFNEISGPRFVSKSWGIIFFFLGAAGMLFHAVRDSNMEVRRTYGVLLGFGLIGVAGVVTIINPNLFTSYGTAALVGALCFLLAFARNEDEPFWRQIIVGALMVLGVAQALIAFGSGLFLPDFLAGPGLVMALLGLAYLCGALVQFAPDSDARRLVAWGLAALAVLGVLYALIRTSLPGLFGAADRPFFVPAGLILIMLSLLYGAVALGTLSDSRTVVMTRRELSAYFYSPVAYLVLLGMAIILALNYFFFLARIELRPQPEPVVAPYGFNLFSVIGTLIVVPAITMRLLSEEKRSGTYEVLMCAPVSETSVVLSKFLAGLIFFLLLWVPAGLYLIALRVEGGKPFDYRPLLSFYMALIFCGAAFVSMGLFFSALTRNQIIAYVLTFVFLLVQVLFYVIRDSTSIGPLWQAVFRHLGYLTLWDEAVSGRLPVRDLILQTSLCIFWLFLTVRVLEARRWS